MGSPPCDHRAAGRQEPARDLYDDLVASNIPADLIGGAYEAAELDAKAAIKQASYLAAAA